MARDLPKAAQLSRGASWCGGFLSFAVWVLKDSGPMGLGLRYSHAHFSEGLVAKAFP